MLIPIHKSIANGSCGDVFEGPLFSGGTDKEAQSHPFQTCEKGCATPCFSHWPTKLERPGIQIQIKNSSFCVHSQGLKFNVKAFIPEMLMLGIPELLMVLPSAQVYPTFWCLPACLPATITAHVTVDCLVKKCGFLVTETVSCFWELKSGSNAFCPMFESTHTGIAGFGNNYKILQNLFPGSESGKCVHTVGSDSLLSNQTLGKNCGASQYYFLHSPDESPHTDGHIQRLCLLSHSFSLSTIHTVYPYGDALFSLL